MARDIFHNDVRKALEADGWTITHDPFLLKAGGLSMEIDLAAEKVLAAEKGGQKIVETIQEERIFMFVFSHLEQKIVRWIP